MPLDESLQAKVDRFVDWLFHGHVTHPSKDGKIINDALLGNQYFSAHEIAVIDSPLLQRLKNIRQTGLVFHVFPSANHTRFEHSLGVVTLAERIFTAVVDRAATEYDKVIASNDRLKGDLAHLRMAALLHDVGHGLCSHASEQIYELHTDMREFRKNPEYAKNAPGEVLSYLIIRSKKFREWFEEIVVGKCHARLDLDLISQMILGKHPDPDKYFLAQIISSPYDADKLDYIGRDSYYCGLALTVDMPRFYSMISTALDDGHRILVLRNYVPLEQMLFSKMVLFGSVYHHQKVKCLDAMLRSTIRHITLNPDQCALDLPGARITFADALEFLYVTDHDFFSTRNPFGDEFTRKMLNRFQRRDLFVRCLEVSRVTVKKWDTTTRKKLVDLSDEPNHLHDVEASIFKNLPTDVKATCNRDEVALSVPNPPKLKGDLAFVQTSSKGPIHPIETYFPVEQWNDAYAHNKWRSFVYGPRQFATKIRDSAVELIRDEFGLDIDLELSNNACHLSD